MDVAALYPNCKVTPTSRKIFQCIRNCGLDFVEVNKPFLMKIVSILTRGVTENQELNRFLENSKAENDAE